MRKFFLGSIALTVFSVATLIFQLSCQKEANALPPNENPYVLPPATTSKLGGVMPDGTTITIDANGRISALPPNNAIQPLDLLVFLIQKDNDNDTHQEIWTSKLDGTNKSKVPITVPVNFDIGGGVQLTPDKQHLIFTMYSMDATVKPSLYSCKLDGSNLVKIVDGSSYPTISDIAVQGVY